MLTSTEQADISPKLYLETMGPLGDTIAHLDGEPINVFGGIPGEKVTVKIVRYRRRGQQKTSGFVSEVHESSPHRISAPCNYFSTCTGCQWQHIEYSYQLILKQESVQNAFNDYPSLSNIPISPTHPGSSIYEYRNHARFTVRYQGSLGFVNRITRRFVKIDRCMLMIPGINAILAKLQGFSSETSQLSVRFGKNTDDFLIQPLLKNPEIPIQSGQKHYTEKLADRIFRIASPSFFQVNTDQAEQLVNIVLKRIDVGAKGILVDCFAGVGTFATLLAQHVDRVIAIEESSSAIKDAQANSDDIKNIDFIQGKAEEVLETITDVPDGVILDPPRSGCHPSTLQALANLSPKNVVYISCDPISLARDLDQLIAQGYVVSSVDPIDMFPQTHHVECVASLKLKSGRS